MTLVRMDNVLLVVTDLEAAIAFFSELGMELEGRMVVEGPWVDRTDHRSPMTVGPPAAVYCAVYGKHADADLPHR